MDKSIEIQKAESKWPKTEKAEFSDQIQNDDFFKRSEILNTYRQVFLFNKMADRNLKAESKIAENYDRLSEKP